MSRQITATRIFVSKSKAIKRIAALLCLCILAPVDSMANTAPVVPPLLETARALQCAVDSSAAEAALKQLKKNRDTETKVPNEWFGTDRESVLLAGTFDIVIDVLLDSIDTYPQNIDLAESVLLGWNFCAVHHNGQYFDHAGSGELASRNQASYRSPAQWRGLQRLGVSKKGHQRYIPIAFTRTNQSTRPQVVYDWWAIQRQQCLPHPGTGELFYKKTLFGPSKVIAKQHKKNKDYPHQWTSDCSVPYTSEEHKIHNLKLAAELAERESRIRLEAAHVYSVAKALEIQSTRQKAKMRNALTNLQASRLLNHSADLKRQRKETTENRVRYMQATAHAKAVIIATIDNINREKARAQWLRRAEAFALRQRLEKAAAIQEAELALQTEQQTPQESPTVAAQEPIAEETIPTLEIAQADAERPYRSPVFTIISPPIGPPEIWDEPAAEIVNPSEQPKSKPAQTDPRPQVYYSEEPELATAIDRTEQKFAKNLQSTPPQTDSTAFPSGSVPPFVEEITGFEDRKYHGFSGSFALSNRRFESISDAWSLTANFGYKPIRSSYFFARTGFTFIDAADGEPVSYYWGIGYNDWHTDTWAFELNHWGPLKPGDGLQIEKAVGSISYKFDSELLKNNGLSSSFSISGGENTAPTATLAGSWTPKPNWFVRTLITQPLEGGDTTWAYGFGYSDWREKTWALEYNNWGPNKAFDLNFRDNALVTLSWKWGF